MIIYKNYIKIREGLGRSGEKLFDCRWKSMFRDEYDLGAAAMRLSISKYITEGFIVLHSPNTIPTKINGKASILV